MNLHSFILVITSVTLSAFGQTAFKIGVGRVQFAPEASIVNKVLGFIGSPFILLGLALYAVGTLFWLFALRNLDLSLAYPFVAFSFIVVFLIGVFMLGEPLNTTRILGLLIITLGLVIMARA
ncbi:MAG: EamA family transporter [Cognatishimia sp.]